jgi:beta-galactosidase
VKRRSFLKTTAAVAAAPLAASALGRAFASTAASPAADGTPRQILPLNRNWRYSPARVEGFEQPEFDDSRFERVAVPHANKLLPWHGFDEHETQFVSAYRRRFRLPAAARAKRVFVDFEGVMTAAKVWINGHRLGEYRGGYTPFTFELTEQVRFGADNVLAVVVDSTERADIPPFGDIVDYLTFGGIYREVSLRLVSPSFIENFCVRTREVLTQPHVEVHCELVDVTAPLTLEAEVYDGDTLLTRAQAEVSAAEASLSLNVPAAVELWDLETPRLYRALVRLKRGEELLDEDSRRFGFREAAFTPAGFMLNGRPLKLRGLNRHQTFPFVGGAMPARVQRQDALILKRQLKVNIVRTSHYPQSRHFLDCCDEIGLLVLEEIPGWQHIGDAAWQELAIDNVGRMIRRDWNHPCIVLWGVRINESRDDHELYGRTNALARQLDPSRPTCGVRNFQSSEFFEDVFTMNDFGFPLKPPVHQAYLNTEFVGHTFPTKSIDNCARLIEHTLRHARIHDQLASAPGYAGGLGWCAFDYNTHGNFGSGDHICYHGVSDIFREPKPAAGFYRSQCEPEDEIVLEPAFHWCTADDFEWLKKVVVCSNCDRLSFYVGDSLVAEAEPDRVQFIHLRRPPFTVDLYRFANDTSRDLRIDGYLGGKLVISRRYSGKSVDRKLELRADSTILRADGTDATRVVFRVTDEFGALKPYATAAIGLELTGPAVLIGDNPFPLWGGLGAVWVRATEAPGTVVLKARHPLLGTEELRLTIEPAPPEAA